MQTNHCMSWKQIIDQLWEYYLLYHAETGSGSPSSDRAEEAARSTLPFQQSTWYFYRQLHQEHWWQSWCPSRGSVPWPGWLCGLPRSHLWTSDGSNSLQILPENPLAWPGHLGPIILNGSIINDALLATFSDIRTISLRMCIYIAFQILSISAGYVFLV